MKTCGVLLITVISVLVRQARSYLQTDGRGPYHILMKGYEDCGKENALLHFVDFQNQHVTEHSVTVKGHISSHFTLSDQIKVRFVMQQFRSTTGWKDNFMVFDFGDKGMCTTMKIAFSSDELESAFSKIVDQEYRTLSQYCDIPPGEYTFSGLHFDWSDFKAFPEFVYGRYRSKNTFYSQEGEIGCHLVYFDVIPRMKTKTTTTTTTTTSTTNT